MKNPVMMPVSLSDDQPDLTARVVGRGWTLASVASRSRAAKRTIDFIRRRFQLAYGAEPELRVPDLLALVSDRSDLVAAVGIRHAGTAPLFLEDYLDRPVEALIPGSGDKRAGVTEIAHLAGAEAGVGRYLFPALSRYLGDLGCRWVVCTGTSHLRNGFERLGIRVNSLAEADPARLPDQGKSWGAYYEHQPEVMALSVEQGREAMASLGLMGSMKAVEGSGGRYGVIA